MSIYYDLTRKSGPFVKEGREISEAEWRAVGSADPELSVEQPEPSPGLRASNAIWAVWRSYPGGYPAWFVLLKGEIEVKGIDEALFGKLQHLATALDARIFCETGEEVT